MTHKSGCLICGRELVYLSKEEKCNCVFCGLTFEVNERCENGHFVCNKCHSSDALDMIFQYCLTTENQNPLEMANILMAHPSVKMHGPEHHFLVPAVLLAAYSKNKNLTNLEVLLQKARKRAETLPGGFCGTHGNCGAAVGTGIFISLITGSTPLSAKEWQLSNMMTSKSLYKVAVHGGPRCCKRDSFLSIIEAMDFLKSEFLIDIKSNRNIQCHFYKLNKECTRKRCSFFRT